MTNKRNSIIFNETGVKNNKFYNLKVILRKSKSFLKEVLSPKINDFYSTLNFLKFRFKVSKKKIKKFKNLHQNETIFLVGAGPSLNNENLDLLNDKIVIAYNFSYQALTNVKPKKFYSCVSGARINPGETIDRSLFDASFRFPGAKEDEHLNLNAIKEDDIILPVPFKFFLYKFKDGGTGFSFDISKEFRHNGGSTGILSCVQIAKYMGSKRIVLLGTDFDCSDKNITHHHDVKFRKTTHWDDDLVKWYQLKKPEIFESLKKLKKILNDNEIEFINASSNTSEKILPKMKLEEIC